MKKRKIDKSLFELHCSTKLNFFFLTKTKTYCPRSTFHADHEYIIKNYTARQVVEIRQLPLNR